MDIPLSKHHSFRVSSNFCNIVGFSAMRTRSSANSSVFTLQSLILIPSAAFFRRPIRSLIKMLNKIGESVHPCFTPRPTSKGGDNLFLIFTELYKFVYSARAFKEVSSLPLMPILVSFCHNSSLGMESKAFLKSTKQVYMCPCYLASYFQLRSIERIYDPDNCA